MGATTELEGARDVRRHLVRAGAYPRCAAARDIRSACAGLVDDLAERWELPSAYLLVDGRLRCQASRGYFQVSDGFTPSTGVIGRVLSSGEGVVLQDVTADPAFVAAVPGLQSEVCMPVRVFGHVVGAVNLESRGRLSREALDDAERAAIFLGLRLEALGGLPEPSLAERLAHIGVELASQSGVADVRRSALASAREISGMRSAALIGRGADGWMVTEAVGPLAPVLRSWDTGVLDLLSGWVRAKTSSYFPPGEPVPSAYEFLAEAAELGVRLVAAAAQDLGADDGPRVGASVGVRMLDASCAGRALADADAALYAAKRSGGSHTVVWEPASDRQPLRGTRAAPAASSDATGR